MFGILAALLVQTAAPAQDVITQPEWLRKPTGQDMADYYPKVAQNRGVSGRATLICKVDSSGGLVDCRSQDENPPGLGFGQAVLGMAHLFRMKPMALNGKPVGGGTVEIPIVFMLPDKGPDPFTGTLLCYGRAAQRAELDPSNAEKWEETRFWAIQAMAAGAQAHMQPSTVERGLLGSHGGTAQPDNAWTSSVDRACQRAMQGAVKK